MAKAMFVLLSFEYGGLIITQSFTLFHYFNLGFEWGGEHEYLG